MTKEDALDALRIIESFQKRFIKRHGNPIVYGADELYLKAEQPFPSLSEYGELHQIENGVGMVPRLPQQGEKAEDFPVIAMQEKIPHLHGDLFLSFFEKIYR